jgi:hypothetical protein
MGDFCGCVLTEAAGDPTLAVMCICVQEQRRRAMMMR